MPLIRIATRESPLALWQATHIKTLIESLSEDNTVEIIGFTTQGDKTLDTTLSKIGGKGLFTKEIEQALLNKTADLAVHCVKDVPYDISQRLQLSTFLERGDPSDALVNSPQLDNRRFADLPEGATVGTSSLRRQAQLLNLRPDLIIKPLRGNVNTRLDKLDKQEFDAIILASIGLSRLGFEHRISQRFLSDELLPAVGQGVLVLQTRSEDTQLQQLIKPLACHTTTICTTAERSMNQALEGNCQTPIGGHATLSGQKLTLNSLVAHPSGDPIIKASAHIILEEGFDSSDSILRAQELGIKVADELLAQGAKNLLATT